MHSALVCLLCCFAMLLLLSFRLYHLEPSAKKPNSLHCGVRDHTNHSPVAETHVNSAFKWKRSTFATETCSLC